jgi:hypothetical protein
LSKNKDIYETFPKLDADSSNSQNLNHLHKHDCSEIYQQRKALVRAPTVKYVSTKTTSDYVNAPPKKEGNSKAEESIYDVKIIISICFITKFIIIKLYIYRILKM